MATEPILNVGSGGIIGKLVQHGNCISVDMDGQYAPDILADICDLDQYIESDSVNTVFMIEVLEHVKNPARAIEQIHRVIRPGGKLFLSVPYAIEIHQAPDDYWRFTPFALQHLLANFEHVQIVARGGYVTASITPLLRLGFQPAFSDKCIGRLLIFLAAIMFPVLWALDRIVRSDAYASGYHVVATKAIDS